MDKPTEKYPWQKCQNEELTEKFRNLHTKLVEEVIHFCHENNLQISEFSLAADGLEESIRLNSWCPYTDSTFSILENFLDDKPLILSC